MSEHETQKLLQEYRERYIRWADKTSSQISFYNNLLLTLGIGFLSFAYQDSKVLYLTLILKDIDSSTAYALSILAVLLSIVTGFIASISRLYDFRVTSQVNLIRQRVLEHAHVRIDEKMPQKLSYFGRMLLPYKLFFVDYPNITLEQCKAWQDDDGNLSEKFSELRAISFNLGLATWLRIKWQTFLLLFAIVLYVVSISLP